MAGRSSRCRCRCVSVAVSVLLALLLAPGLAGAQLHWDASAQAGVAKRFMTSRPAGSGDAGVGPTGQLTGHVALLPLVRVGAYISHDIAPMPGDMAARQLTSAGGRVKGMLPWVRGALRSWVFAGFGYARTYAPSYATSFALTDGAGSSARHHATVQGAGGGFFDVPFGIGASYKVFEPWTLCAELGARAGFGHTGSLYEAPGPAARVEGAATQRVAPAGLDRFAVGLTLGVMLDL